MKSARGVVTTTCRGAAAARAVVAALAPDDAGFIATVADGNRVVATATASDPLTLLRTLDDHLSCLAVALASVDAAP